MATEISLFFLTFFTSTVAGVVGFGGGMILITVLPSFIPINALVPIHGLTQTSSTLSRAFFGYKDIQYKVVPKFLLGSLLGVGFFAVIIYIISLEYVPLFIGFYILLSLWSNKFNEKIKQYENYYLAGFFQSGLSLIVGATGPLAMTLLLKDLGEKKQVIATAAVLMSITHILKLFVYIFFGFVFSEYLLSLAFLISGAVLGSYVGTKLMRKIEGKKFIKILKILLSILAIKTIIFVFI